MGQIILILLIVTAAIIGAVFLVEAWNGQQDARAQRIAAEAGRIRAEGEADATRVRANAEAASVRADANSRQIAMLFPWMIVLVFATVATFVGVTLMQRAQNVPAQSAEVLALAALGRMLLAAQQQGLIEIPTYRVTERQEIEA